MKIRIFYDNLNFRLKESRKAIALIEKVIIEESFHQGDLSFIFTNDKEIIKINREFLKHNYYTDVIAFGYNDGKILNGEIYISIDTVRKNANNYKVSLKNEALRVMIHGTLHLCGYEDGGKEEKERMRVIENKWLIKAKRKYGIQI